MSQRDVRYVRLLGRPLGINFEHSAKRISEVIFSVLVHQIFVLDT